MARPRVGSDLAAALLVAARALAGAALADFAGALAARDAVFAGAFVAVLVARRAGAAPLDVLAVEPFAPAVAEDLAAVRFAGASVADRALVAAT